MNQEFLLLNSEILRLSFQRLIFPICQPRKFPSLHKESHSLEHTLNVKVLLIKAAAEFVTIKFIFLFLLWENKNNLDLNYICFKVYIFKDQDL